MSTVLEEFVAPMFDVAEGYEACSTVISIGIVAWNAALEPDYRRAAFISSAIDAAMKDADIHERLRCKALIENLVVRKLQHFAEYRRPILAFHLNELDDGGFYLSVASAVVLILLALPRRILPEKLENWGDRRIQWAA